MIFPIGTQQSAVWNAETAANNNPTISYTYQDKRAEVELICAGDDTNLFEALGEIATNDFRFRLTHKNACWKKLKGKSTRPIRHSLVDRKYGQNSLYIIVVIAMSGLFPLIYFALRCVRASLGKRALTCHIFSSCPC